MFSDYEPDKLPTTKFYPGFKIFILKSKYSNTMSI